MIFEQILVGGSSRNFVYIIGDEESSKAVVVDPAFDQDKIHNKLVEHGLAVSYIMNTHGHGDHVGGNADFKAATGAEIVAHESLSPDIAMKHGDTFKMESLEFTFYFTPGHADDHFCIRCDNKLITGDILFVGKVGGTGTPQAAQIEYDSLHNIVMALPNDLEVWPGHNFGISPSSTIGNERETNPFLLQLDFDAFLHLKDNWADYKKKHGIA